MATQGKGSVYVVGITSRPRAHSRRRAPWPHGDCSDSRDDTALCACTRIKKKGVQPRWKQDVFVRMCMYVSAGARGNRENRENRENCPKYGKTGKTLRPTRDHRMPPAAPRPHTAARRGGIRATCCGGGSGSSRWRPSVVDGPSRRRDCHFCWHPLSIPIETSTRGEGGWCRRTTVWPTAAPTVGGQPGVEAAEGGDHRRLPPAEEGVDPCGHPAVSLQLQ